MNFSRTLKKKKLKEKIPIWLGLNRVEYEDQNQSLINGVSFSGIYAP